MAFDAMTGELKSNMDHRKGLAREAEWRRKTEKAQERAEAANKEKLETFAYSVSHGLRAPLRPIIGFSAAVLEDYAPKLDDEGRRYLGLIQAGLLPAGRQGMAPAPVDPGALAAGIINRHGGRLRAESKLGEGAAFYFKLPRGME